MLHVDGNRIDRLSGVAVDEFGNIRAQLNDLVSVAIAQRVETVDGIAPRCVRGNRHHARTVAAERSRRLANVRTQRGPLRIKSLPKMTEATVGTGGDTQRRAPELSPGNLCVRVASRDGLDAMRPR